MYETDIHWVSIASHYMNGFFIQCLETVAWNETSTIS